MAGGLPGSCRARGSVTGEGGAISPPGGYKTPGGWKVRCVPGSVSPALSPRCQALPVTSRFLHRECGDNPGTGLGSHGGAMEGRCPLGRLGPLGGR